MRHRRASNICSCGHFCGHGHFSDNIFELGSIMLAPTGIQDLHSIDEMPSLRSPVPGKLEAVMC